MFCVFLLAANAEAQEYQWWSEIDLTASTRSADWLVPIVARADSSLPNPQLAAAGVEVDVQLARHFTLTAGYLFADLPQRAHLHVHIPLVAVSATLRAGPFRLADRNRFEQLIGFGSSPVRYRNRAFVDLPLGDGGRWHAFIDDEVFVDVSAWTWSQNRFQLGGGARMFRRVSLDAYYLLRSVSGDVPSTRVFGTTVRVMLNQSRESLQ